MQAVVGLCRIDLRAGPVIRLSAGAEIKWGADLFVPFDPSYGALGGVDALGEGVGVEVPALQLTLLAPSATAAAALVQPGEQTARVRLWLAAYDPDTGLVTDAGDARFDGFLDTATLAYALRSLELRIQCVSVQERFFELNIGNSLSPTFHKSIWPGETGEDQATGLVIQDAWGVEAPPQQVAAPIGGAGGGMGLGFGDVRLL